ncbi:germin-like protein 9 [Actinidia rufa]|uniref:Germin-like protein 9 n=1 Tax=Actinidia rufa TaxID=165716 RepID=A0A7J0FL90_9ERIC|nr:germin-like protein 9 [Actinidia rufa]
MANHIVLLSLVALSFCYLAFAFEPSPLQDFCVADPTSSARVNGLACKNPMTVQANDFFFSGLHIAGNTSNPIGSRVTPVNVAQIPGLNTLGISMVRIDYAPWGINPPHTHPRASEILTIVEGYGNAVAIASLSSQNPGVITVANAVFGSNPAIAGDILAKAFQVDKKIVEHIQSKF